jgi:pyruvate formate lyase activating enzyme
MIGYIHSKESFGTVDGPGIRYVLFMQGCPMRCLYCHNPDTWEISGGSAVTPEQIIEEFEKNRPFYKDGGITVTGGEPLLQIDFLIELFMLAKAKGIHTCIDTSGITYTENTQYLQKLDKLMSFCDLVMLDIKHIDNEIHKALTGHSNERILAFAKYLADKNIPIWIRHVIVKGYTDRQEHLFALGQFIGALKSLKALDVLPYHTMGEVKYTKMEIPYPLAGVPATTNSEAEEAKNTILKGIYSVRNK